MSIEEKFDGIKIIAVFDGWVQVDTYAYEKQTDDGLECTQCFDLEYATSFDYLMPIIKKFSELEFEGLDLENYMTREFKISDIQNEMFKSYSAHKVFPLVVEAIEWYNSNKK